MNKLLIHMMNAGDIDHKILPGLPKAQKGKQTTSKKRGETVLVDGKRMNTYSDEYEKAYNKGIGQWVSYDKASGQWNPLPGNLPNSAYNNAEFVSGVVDLPEVTVSSKLNPNVASARKKAQQQLGSYEDYVKGQQSTVPKWAERMGFNNKEADRKIYDQNYGNLLNTRTYQNLVDAIPQKENESRVNYINRFNNLAGKNAVSLARQANVTEPFDPNNLYKLGQWGWKGLNHIAALNQAMSPSNTRGFMPTIQEGIDRGNMPIPGMLPDEAKEIGITQPFETVDDLAYRYGFRPALKAGDNLMNPAGSQSRNFNSRYLGASDEDKVFTSLMNPLNYITGSELLSGGKNIAKATRLGEGLETAGKFLTERTPLRNTYKINPFAFTPEETSAYRMIGDDAGVQDLITSGKVRPSVQGSDLGRTHSQTFYSQGVPYDGRTYPKYGKQFSRGFEGPNMVEVPNYADNSSFGYGPAGKQVGAQALTYPGSEIGINNVNLYKQDWLQGYKKVNNLLNSSSRKTNLDDLMYAKKVYGPLGYQIPENLERISQSDLLTDRTIRGLVNRDNSFYRGVNVDLEALKQRLINKSNSFKQFNKNPQEDPLSKFDNLIAELRSANIDPNDSEEVAKYMATHIPGETGAGRFGVDMDQLAKKGLDALYTSNSLGTAEGYTYGKGYIVKAKKPTDFSSSNRRAWINNNVPDIQTGDNYKLRTFSSKPISWKTEYEKLDQDVINNYREKLGYERLVKEFPEILSDERHTWESIVPEMQQINDRRNQLRQIADEEQEIARARYEDDAFTTKDRLNRFEGRFDLNNTPRYQRIIKRLTSPSFIKDVFMDAYYDKKLGDINKINSKAWKEASVIPWLERYPDLANAIPEVNPYAHYIHIGKPGQKVLEPMSVQKISPETWINKSRGHQGQYSRQATRREFGGEYDAPQYMMGGQPCYECGGSVKRYDVGGFYDCPDQEKDPVTGKCAADVARGRQANAANKAATKDMNSWAKQVAAMDKELAKQYAAQDAGQITFDYDWMQNRLDKADKKAAVAGYKQFFQQNPNVFVADDTSGYSPEQKYIIASKLKQRMSTPMGSKLAQQQFGVDPRFYDLQRMQSEMAPKMGGWNGMRNWLFNVYKQDGGPIVDPRGQWAHPGQVTRIPSSNITMQGVPYPVYGVGSNGQKQMMYPGQEYNFGGASYVDEYPMMQFGGGTLLGPSPMIMSLASKVANFFSKPKSSGITDAMRKSAKDLFYTSYNQMNSAFYDKNEKFYDKLRANDTKKYDNSSNSINLSSGRFRGAKVAPAMINDIVNAAKANNVDPWVMLSLVGRESTFGSDKEYVNHREAGNKQDLISGWNVAEDYQPYEVNRYLADKKVPGIKVLKDNSGWNYEVEDGQAIENYLKSNPNIIDGYYKKLESTPDLGNLDSFSLAAQRIKKKGIQNYNPGDPRYSSMVNQDMGLLKQDAALKAYMKTLGYKEGGEFGEGLLSKTVSCSNCGWSWEAVDGGSDPLTCHKCGGIAKMKNGGYIVTRSNDRKGKTHKVTGPDGTVKYFGDSKLGQHPKDPERKAAFYARHKKNLDGNPYFRAFAKKTWEDGGTIKMQRGGMSSADSVRHQAGKILKYEQLRGGPGGTPLPYYSDPSYMNMLMNDIYPQVKKLFPNASAMEAGEAMDFIFNAGWDKASKKITKDPRAYALQEYYRQYDPSKLDAQGNWSGRKNPAYSFDQEYNSTIGKLSENQRRVLMNKGRDWYYRNINNPAPGVPNSNYDDTWYGRIWNTNDFLPFNPNNPNFKPKKEDGGELSLWDMIKMAQGGEMIRRADGSYSKRGLWDNIRANKGSGKKPTKQMLEQERKIKSKNK